MAWTDDLLAWLQDEGARIGVWLLIYIFGSIAWNIVCKIMIKTMVMSSIKARETVLRSKYRIKHGMNSRSSSKIFQGLPFSKKKNKNNKDQSSKKHHISDKSVDIDELDTTTTTSINANEEMKDIESGNSENLIQKSKSTLSEELKNITVPDDERRGFEARSQTIGGVLRKVGHLVLLLFTVISIFDILGIPTETLLGASALIGLALALSIQTVAGDFANGLFILAENQYFVGESVIINDIEGEVEDLSLRTTKVRDDNGYLHTIPNGDIRTVTNISRDYNMAELIVTLPYDGEDAYNNAVSDLNTIIGDKLRGESSLIRKDGTNIIFEYPKVLNIEAYGDDSISVRYSAKVKPGEMETVRDVMIKHLRINFPKCSCVPYEDNDEAGTTRRTYFASQRTQAARLNNNAIMGAAYLKNQL